MTYSADGDHASDSRRAGMTGNESTKPLRPETRERLAQLTAKLKADRMNDEDEAAAYGEIDQARAELKAERDALVKERNQRRWLMGLALALLALMIVHVCVRLSLDAMALGALMGVCE